MRSAFQEWYPPTPDELERLWREAIVVTDSSVLLALYQYPPTALEQFFRVLEALGDRLWIPHQVGLEFQRNRLGRIPEQRAVLDELIKRLDEASRELDRVGLPEYHPVLDRDEFERRQAVAAEAIDALGQLVRNTLAAIPERTPEDLIYRDELFARITGLFEANVGAPFTDEELDQLYSEGARRYDRQLPPGYKDIDKEVPRRYGDLIVWKQILNHARRGQGGMPSRSTLLVTGEKKEDWWRRRESAMLGPRPELIREYLDVVGAGFHMYRPDQFLEDARQYLKLDVSSATIEDVRRISTSSPVMAILRSQRMVVPETATRVLALRQIYDAAASGSIRVANDVNTAIGRLGEPFDGSYVATPLFFALIHEAYGPIRIEPTPSLRLRDRAVTEIRGIESTDEFVALGQAAWIAQALYRLRFERLPDEDVLSAFFGPDPQTDANALLTRAQTLVAAELSVP
jgi:hypothetical protein